MREFKFRAWLIDAKIMLADQTPSSSSKVSIYMQYTGLKDKNGVEIYEGDIVQGFSRTGTVEWLNVLTWECGGSPHPGFWCKEWCEYGDTGELSYHDGFNDECEVIGNIYEQPELLHGAR